MVKVELVQFEYILTYILNFKLDEARKWARLHLKFHSFSLSALNGINFFFSLQLLNLIFEELTLQTVAIIVNMLTEL